MKSKATEALEKFLSDNTGERVYFHNKDNNEELSGIYRVAALGFQDPYSGQVLLLRDKAQAWAKLEHLQFDTRTKPIDNIERVVLMSNDGTKFEFKSLEVASLLLIIANANPKYTEEIATGKAMEWLSEFLTREYWLNEKCTLMTYNHWRKNYEPT